ncbi:MAG: 2-dehydro-3-deoxygalactonokinase [Paracoccaceae bacterium]
MQPEWIAVDWGTSNLRAWAMGPNGPDAMATSDEGMGKLTPDQFEPALLRLIAPWLSARITPVLACGMVGARQGWREAAYRAVPCTPLAANGVLTVPTSDTRITVKIAPGLSQSRPADVMRGEETQIAGALALHPDFDGVLCLPGTHSKWAHISAGEVVSFQTFMTGELFALLSTQSVLRHGMADGWDDTAFDEGLSDAFGRPDRIAAKLFALRAEGLLHGLPPAQARARLSGLLIGIELAGAKPYWLGQNVKFIGAPALSANYARALAAQGVKSDTLDATACTLAGLIALHKQIGQTR